MKKLLISGLLLFFTLTAFTPTSNVGSDNYVYVCQGPQSHKYHKTKKCKGLCKCSTELKKLDRDEAKRAGYTACKICYKKVTDK